MRIAFTTPFKDFACIAHIKEYDLNRDFLTLLPFRVIVRDDISSNFFYLCLTINSLYYEDNNQTQHATLWTEELGGKTPLGTRHSGE
mgnify:CR=1 FL=1